MTDCILCTWRVRSALPLPETAPWRGPDHPVDIEIRSGQVPTVLGELTADLPYLEATPDGGLLFHAMPHARFLVTPDSVVVDTALPPEVPDWRAFLLGPVLGLLCYLRGLLPLHASVVRIRGRAVAFAGRSGAGKSTLAAALSARGHPLVTDDVCPVALYPATPLVFPTFPGLRLTSLSLQALGADTRGLAKIRVGQERYQLPRMDGFDPLPLPLDAVYLLEDAPEGADASIVGVSGAEAFERLSADIYRPEIGRFLFAKPVLFTMATRLFSRVAVRRLVRPPGLDGLPALLQLIEMDTAARCEARSEETIVG